MSAEREAEQIAWGTWKFVNRHPCFASRSTFGVGYAVFPNGRKSA
jgi:hypothetical protein